MAPAVAWPTPLTAGTPNILPLASAPRANTAVEKVGVQGAALMIRRLRASDRTLATTIGTARMAASDQVAPATA